MRVVCSMGFLVVTVMIKDKINDYLKATLQRRKKVRAGWKAEWVDEWNLKEKLINCAASNSRVVPFAPMQIVVEFSSIYMFGLLAPLIA
jgi:hypothetical protein